MSGHSHWAGIKHKKAANDAKRGKAWSKLARAIIVAARVGGGDPDANLSLKYAIDKAKAANMPKDTIERAVKKGAGELGGEDFAELLYEVYAPGGVALLIEILTDNRNRTAPEIKKILERRGASLGASGSVAWIFQTKGLFRVEGASASEDKLVEIALEAGADDVHADGDDYEITCEPAVFEAVKQALDAAKVPVASAELTRIPQNSVLLDAAAASKVLKLMEELDDHDDVQNISANFEIPDELMAQMETEGE